MDADWEAASTAVCAVCKQSYATKQDGTLRKHTCCPWLNECDCKSWKVQKTV